MSHRLMSMTGMPPVMSPARPILTSAEVRAAARTGVLLFAEWPKPNHQMMRA